MEHLDTERISAYIDGELPPDDMRRVEYHLMSCETCRREYDDLRGVATLVRELPVYLPRREISLEGAGASDGSAVLARIIEFSKPLAVAAILIIVAFAGLRLIGGIGDGDNGDGDQISFSEVQETATAGTEPGDRTSESVAADAPAAGAAPDEAEEDAAEMDEEAPAAAMPAQANRLPAEQAASESQQADPATAPVQATIIATATSAPSVSPDDTDEDDALLSAGIVIATVVLVGGAAAWYMLFRSPRRTRR
jgi:hypothetical protein